MRVLSRYPESTEAARAKAYLDESAKVPDALRDLVWALVNTREFIVNR